MTPDYISPKETEIEKHRLIELLKPELKTHGLTDLTTFVKDKSIIHENHRHSGFVRSLAYKAEELGFAEVIPQEDWKVFFVKRTIYSKRHPIKFAAILFGVGVIFSVIAGTTNAIIAEGIKSKKPQKEFQELKQTQQDLSEELTRIQYGLKDVQDTLAKYK